VIQNKANIESSLTAAGVPKARADQIADALSHAGGGRSSEFSEGAGRRAQELFDAVQHDFALSTRSVFYVMAGFMALAFVVSLVAMPAGRAETVTPEARTG
jgi:hypothetical protein